MRVFVPFVLLAILAAGTTPIQAGPDRPVAPPSAGVALGPADRTKTLDQLFARLAEAGDRAEAGPIEADIRQIWLQSDSATADLLLSWTDLAVAAGNEALALDLLDELSVRAPMFAEAYYRRATLHLMAGRLSPALADLRTVLRIEPRHFLAMRELAGLFEDIGQHERALAVLRQLQQIDRNCEGLDEAIEAIVAGTHGRDA